MHVCVFVFDLLYVDGEALVHLPLRQRRARLAAALPNLQPGHVQFATSVEFQPAAVAAAAAAAEAKPGTAKSGAVPAAAVAEGDPAAATTCTGEAAKTDVSASSDAKGHKTSLAPDPNADPQLATRLKDGVQVPEAGENSAIQDAKHILATGGGDIDATADAAAAMAAAVAKAPNANEHQHHHSQSVLKATGDGSQLAADSAPAPAAADLATALSAAEAVAGVSELAMQSIEDRIQEFLLESFAGGTEGLMLKALDVAAGYQPSKRSDSWIKLKR